MPFKDLFVFNQSEMVWKDLTKVVKGKLPSARVLQGFAVDDGLIYVHGGVASGKQGSYPFEQRHASINYVCIKP